MKRLLLVILLFVTFFNVKSQDLMNMSPTGFVNDYENIFSTEEKNDLEKMLSDYARTTTAEISVVTVTDFPAGDHIAATNLFNKWGIGNKNFKNGLLIVLSKSQRKVSIVTGYGLEEFLPDGKLSEFTPDMKNYFKSNDYYGGVKSVILNVQKELGDQGLEFARKQREIEKEKSAENFSNALYTLLYVFLILLILSGIAWVIIIQYKKRKLFLELKKEIRTLLNNNLNLKKELGDKIDSEVQKYYFSIMLNFVDNSTNKFVNEETRTNLQRVYDKLSENKQIIDNIDNSILSIGKIKSDIQKYLQNDYPYCDKYLKDQLNNILLDTKIDDGDYTRLRASRLMGVHSNIESNMRVFSKILSTINSCVSDFKNLDKKYNELVSLHSEYIRKKNILASVKIGSKYNSLATLDFSQVLNKLDSYIRQSFNSLEKDDAMGAMSIYGNYITTLTSLTSTFNSVDVLFTEYNNSDKYIRDNHNKIDGLWSSIEYKINKSGVSYHRKTTYEQIKSNINKYKATIAIDMILAASLLKTCLSDLEKLLSSINSDISSHEDSERRAAAAALAAISYSSSNSNSNSYSSSSDSDSFNGFGGGDSGGSGVSTGW